MSVKQELVEKIREVLAGSPEARLLYVFGSQVQGNLGPLSDIDLGVLFEQGTDEEQALAVLRHALVKALGSDRIDLVPLQRAPVELAYAVISQGICIYQIDVATRVEYEAQVLGRYGDYLPVLRAQRAEILQGGDHGRGTQRYREALRRTRRTLKEIRSAKE